MANDNILQEIMDLESKMEKLPPLSAREAAAFDTENITSSVFYSNLLEGNALSREEAIKAMKTEKDDELDK